MDLSDFTYHNSILIVGTYSDLIALDKGYDAIIKTHVRGKEYAHRIHFRKDIYKTLKKYPLGIHLAVTARFLSLYPSEPRLILSSDIKLVATSVESRTIFSTKLYSKAGLPPYGILVVEGANFYVTGNVLSCYAHNDNLICMVINIPEQGPYHSVTIPMMMHCNTAAIQKETVEKYTQGQTVEIRGFISYKEQYTTKVPIEVQTENRHMGIFIRMINPLSDARATNEEME